MRRFALPRTSTQLLVAALSCAWCFAHAERLKADQFPTGPYLIAGSAEYTGGTPDPDRSRRPTQFLVAVTRDRALVGWSRQSDEVEGVVENFRFVGSRMSNPIGFRFHSKPGLNFLEATERQLQYVALQSNAVDADSDSRFAAIQMAAFSNYPFAIFFSSQYVGIHPRDVAALLVDRPEGTSTYQNTCGTLTVHRTSEGWRAFEFVQRAGDLLTVRVPGKKLEDVTSDPFTSGLNRVFYSCTFEPPLAAQPTAPWEANCVVEKEGRNKLMNRTEYRVKVDVYSSDEMWIDNEISAVLQLIPEQEEVQSNDPVDYVWKGEQIVRKIDPRALSTAEGVKFQNRARRVLWILNCVGLVLVAVFFLVRRLWRRKL